MTENGIMQDIRELLSKGQSAPEIIAQGYAPSTVYRVQRDIRRKSGFNSTSRYRKEASSCGLEYWNHLEAENQLLHQRLDSLASQLADVADESSVVPLWERFEEVQRSLETIAVRQEQIARELQASKAIIGKIDTELDALAEVFKEDAWFGNPKWQRRSARR